MKKKALSTMVVAQHLAKAVAEADADGSQTLDFEEFTRLCKMAHVVPSAMVLAAQNTPGPWTTRPGTAITSDEALRQLFNSVDTNGNGKISMDEVFMWALLYSGRDAFYAFQKFDQTGEGQLDAREVSSPLASGHVCIRVRNAL